MLHTISTILLIASVFISNITIVRQIKVIRELEEENLKLRRYFTFSKLNEDESEETEC